MRCNLWNWADFTTKLLGYHGLLVVNVSIYKFFNNDAPAKKNFHPIDTLHNTHKSKHRLIFPHRKNNRGQKGLSFMGPKIWNNLHSELKTIKDVNTFKHKIKNIFSISFKKRGGNPYEYTINNKISQQINYIVIFICASIHPFFEQVLHISFALQYPLTQWEHNFVRWHSKTLLTRRGFRPFFKCQHYLMIRLSKNVNRR